MGFPKFKEASIPESVLPRNQCLAGSVAHWRAMERTFVGRGIIYSKARKGVMSKSKGHYPAPLEAIEVLKADSSSFGIEDRGAARTGQFGARSGGSESSRRRTFPKI